MRVAVTGVSGFIGSVLARTLHERGHAVTGLVRGTRRRDHVEPFVDRFVVGDQADREAWPELLDGADGVIHNSFDWHAVRHDRDRHLETNLVGAIALMHAAESRHFVYMSTIAVHHDMRPRWEGVIDEDHPTLPATEYGACKAAVEAHGWARFHGQGHPFTALRPCGVYGMDPDPRRSHGWRLVEKIRAGASVSKAGGGKFVHVEDVAAAAAAALEQPDRASGRPFNLVDCYARWCDWADLAAEVLGIAPESLDVDRSSPPRPNNDFDVSATRALGVPLDRGHAGIRAHLEEVVAAIDDRGRVGA